MARYYTSTRLRPQCPTCGNNLGQLEESFKRLQEQGKSPVEALESLGVHRPCCRVRALWPVVLPLGGFYLPHHEAAMLNYLGLKPPDPQPNLVVMSLRKAASGEYFLISHVDKEGFVGRIASAEGSREPTEVEISGELNTECAVRVRTEPGEITRGFPFETRAFRRDIQVDRVKSYFDLAPVEEEEKEEKIIQMEELVAPEDEQDEPLVTSG